MSASRASRTRPGSTSSTLGLPGASSRTSRRRPSAAFLSRCSAFHAESESTATGSGRRTSSTRAGFLVETGHAQRGREPEGDRSAVRHGVARRGLERVRERMPEVELDPLAALERVPQADRRLERGAPADLLVRLELPEAIACQEPRLDDFGEAVATLLLGERLEQRRVDDRLGGPVERPDEVLALREVDRRLAADRGVDLAEEGRRHRDPVDAAEVGRRDEAREVRGRATADGDERRAALEPECAPEALGFDHGLCGVSGRNGVRRGDLVQLGDTRVGDERSSRCLAMRAEPYARRGERRAVQVGRASVGRSLVQGPPLLVERAELVAGRVRAADRRTRLDSRHPRGSSRDGARTRALRVPHASSPSPARRRRSRPLRADDVRAHRALPPPRARERQARRVRRTPPRRVSPLAARRAGPPRRTGVPGARPASGRGSTCRRP